MPDNIRRVILKGRLFGTVETRNMFCYRLHGVAIEPTATTYLYSQISAIALQAAPMLASAWATYEMEMQTLVGHQWYPLGVEALVIGGANSEDPAGYQPAVLLRAITGALKVVGRKYFAGISENMTLAGALNSSALVAAAATLAAYLEVVSLGGENSWNPGVVDKLWNFREFLGGTVGTIISSMRRRKPGYGI